MNTQIQLCFTTRPCMPCAVSRAKEGGKHTPFPTYIGAVGEIGKCELKCVYPPQFEGNAK